MSFSSIPDSWAEALETMLACKDELIDRLSAQNSIEEVHQLRADVIGRRSILFKTLQDLKKAPVDVRKIFSEKIKNLRFEIEELIQAKIEQLRNEQEAQKIKNERVDVTLPGKPILTASLHPISQTIDAIVKFFSRCGFQVASGPEIESDYYNFEALNLPKEHPAQAQQDSFWLSKTHLLRTHTSGIQIRTLEKVQPPLRILAPGRVFRPDSDMTHTPMFHQIEGLLVQEAVSFSELKGLIQACLQELFWDNAPEVRFRPSDFPFTVPSAEVDLKLKSHGDQWLEVLGCGMVHPKVLSRVGIDPKRFKGFAFGMGIERLAMLRYGIPDLRSFYENDLRFLKQFGH